ncbi:kinase-like protein [Dacryopinax primogenitus]|uniref:Kinase-like protein n=1 Tax=Dacryopinax primogenitus (strain DJM 731) TaxID=1858805 RepID=M5G6C6_DACPD|nr:kinase-like protein [Dacryopinax primogenitus]EJU05811.1 kinase-like protein [Dacryopinax primogenitus]
MLHVPGGGGVEERKEGRLVAVKCLDRAMCDANDRTRISFVREVEVLRHVCHPSIVSYLHSFTTVTHHCLVLEYLAGGELFSLLDNDDKYRRMTEPLVRRMFGELVRAVGWMHGVALVHRDIKLENILLTCDPFLISSYPSLDDLPTPLLKLSDFGLSRFIDPAKPLLQTRCGSESYAAPEIVMGQKYDGRQTDAWACGVVLYALATRVLPFDPNATDAHAGTGGSFRGGREGRKALLFRIAKGDYSWPKDPRPSFPVPDMLTPHGTIDSDPVRSLNLATPGLKHVVARLLVRDPAKRAKVIELWDDEWMQGPGAPAPPHRDADSKRAELVDGDSIGEIARNEVV